MSAVTTPGFDGADPGMGAPTSRFRADSAAESARGAAVSTTESAAESVDLVAEFTVEPFVEGHPGPHVLAALAAAQTPGLQVDVGPFGTEVRGDSASVSDAIARVITSAMAQGATRVSIQVQRRSA